MVYYHAYDAAGKSEDRKQEHKIGRELLKRGLEREYGSSYPVVQQDGKKPRLQGADGIYFNISHTRGMVVCAIADHEIGIDVEKIRNYEERLMRRICSEDEIAYIERTEDGRAGRFFQIWTLKESYVKAIGTGLSFPFQNITFEIQQKADSQEPERIVSNIPGFLFHQSRLNNQYIISICEPEEIHGEALEKEVFYDLSGDF